MKYENKINIEKYFLKILLNKDKYEYIYKYEKLNVKIENGFKKRGAYILCKTIIVSFIYFFSGKYRLRDRLLY